MLIFGRTNGASTAGIYIYECQFSDGEFISVGASQVALNAPVV
jgi:hypothetical protein